MAPLNPYDQSQSRGIGYLSAEFLESLEEFGDPYTLPESRGDVLIRNIPCPTAGYKGETYRDAIGTYPMFFPIELQKLALDMHTLKYKENGLVSFTAVLDPFTSTYQIPSHDPEVRSFVMGGVKYSKFKPHVIINVSSGNNPFADYSRHHQDRVNKSLQKGIDFVWHDSREHAVCDWIKMQSILNDGKKLTGMKRMSKEMIEKQCEISQLEVLSAYQDGELIGVSTWIVHVSHGFSHTTAMSDKGRKNLAGYAMYSHAIRELPAIYPRLQLIDLGSYASATGINTKSIDGLSYFKCGWSSSREYTYLLSCILDESKYEELQDTTNTRDVTNYFPAYRNGEML